MAVNEKPSLLLQYVGILWFMSMSIGALIWFGVNAVFTVRQLATNQASISFDKGAFYMLGIGIALGALVIAMILEVWKKKPTSDNLSRKLTRTALLGIAITFLLPQVVHYPLAHYLQQRGYQVCREASYQWLLYRKIVFMNDQEKCLELANKK